MEVADAILVYVGESAGWNDLEGEFRVHSVAVTAYANSEGVTITFTGQLTDIYTGDDDATFTFGAVDDTVRLVFVTRRPVTAYIPHQVGTDDHNGVIAYDSGGKIAIRDPNDLPTKLGGLATDLTEAEQETVQRRLGLFFHHFEIPKDYVLPMGLRHTTDEGPSTYNLGANILHMMPTHLHEHGSYQYTLLARLHSSNSGGSGSIRVTLYTWDDVSSNWVSQDSVEVDDLSGFDTTNYEPTAWLSLPSEYADSIVSGVIMIGIQASGANIITPATKGTNTALDAIVGPNFLVNSSGTNRLATVSHPSTGFVSRTGFFAYRRPTTAEQPPPL